MPDERLLSIDGIMECPNATCDGTRFQVGLQADPDGEGVPVALRCVKCGTCLQPVGLIGFRPFKTVHYEHDTPEGVQ